VSDVPFFRVGESNREHVTVRPTRREYPEARDYWDGNWLNATVEIVAGGFRGKYEALLRAEEFAQFRDQLRPLYEHLSEAATFTTMEDWLRIHIEGDGKGHFQAQCQAVDQPGLGNRLTFSIEFDQTELPAIVRSLDEVCVAFPVVGTPGGSP
jgi:hypothetical protein